MRRLFAAVAAVCVTTGLLRTSWELVSNRPDSESVGIIATLLVILSVLGLGATIGAMTGNVTDGVIGFPLMVVILLVAAAFALNLFLR